MKHNPSVRSLSHSIRSLFSTKKGVNPHKRYPDEYYNRYYFNNKLCDGITLVAKIERTNKKAAAEYIMELGFSSYMGAMIKQQIQLDKIARENNEKMKMTRFIREVRKFAIEHGMDISKIF